MRNVKESSVAAGYSAGYVWYVVVLLTVVNVFNYVDRMALAVLLPFIKADLTLSDGQLGLLVGLAFSLFYAVCGIPIARYADRGVRKNIIAVALAVWSVMTALSGAAQNFWHLFFARVGIGAGEAGCLPPAQSIICDYVPLKRRSGVFAIHAFGLTGGMMVGMALAGWLGDLLGWRWTFVVLGAPGIGLAIILHLTLREPVRGAFDAPNAERIEASFGKTMMFLWRCRTYRLLTILYALNGFVQYGLNQWLPSFYARLFDLSMSSVGVYLGFAIGAGSAIGLLIGGILANKAAERDIRSPLMIGVAATALALPVVLASLFVPSASGSILLVSLSAILWSVLTGPVIATATGVVPSRMRATAGAINIFFAAVLGFGLGPLCVGVASDLLTPVFGDEALRYALVIPACLLPVMAVVLYSAANALRTDLENQAALAPDSVKISASSAA